MTTRISDTPFPESILAAKKERRRRLAALPIEEKLRILVEMQRLASDIARSAGRPTREPWVLDGGGTEVVDADVGATTRPVRAGIM